MKELVFLLEERSAEEMLKQNLPKILPKEISCRYISFEGKQDLEKNIERKIKGWLRPDSCFIILHDQDSADCKVLKKALAAKCARAGRKDALVRIACHELESFYLGDLEAVKTAYGIPVPSQKNRKFRTPDNLANAAEELKKITKMKYQKVEGSRLIARHLKLDGSSSSASFNALLSGILRLIY